MTESHTKPRCKKCRRELLCLFTTYVCDYCEPAKPVEKKPETKKVVLGPDDEWKMFETELDDLFKCQHNVADCQLCSTVTRLS